MRIVEPSVRLEWSTPHPDKVIGAAGRTCYKSETFGREARFIAMILKRGHESVIEHASASFRIVCDRGVSHELVRHRLASYSQESTRYCNYAQDKHGSEISVVRPPDLEDRSYIVWLQACVEAENAYLALSKGHGLSPQIARSVLPTCLKTEIVMTCNFREWRHFLRLRLSKEAHPQMRQIAEMIRDELVELSTACFGEFDTEPQDG